MKSVVEDFDGDMCKLRLLKKYLMWSGTHLSILLLNQ